MKRVRKWEMLRIPLQTHKELLAIKRRSGLSMSETVARLIHHVYAGGTMTGTALTFFIVYLDNVAMFIVASKDAQAAELGLRQQLLGMKPAPKEIKARTLAESPTDDVLKIGLAAIMTQLTNVQALLTTPPPSMLDPKRRM